MEPYRVAWAYGVDGRQEYGYQFGIPMDADDIAVAMAESECRHKLQAEGVTASHWGTRVIDPVLEGQPEDGMLCTEEPGCDRQCCKQAGDDA